MGQPTAKGRELVTRHDAAMAAIAEAARTLPALLEDLGHKRSAAPLQEALFAYDAVKQEMQAHIREHAKEMAASILAAMEKGPLWKRVP